ncbi:sulfite exporter TauE/SafE family protein [Flavobacterium sp.]|uniref:sulfite exporter TauE/SafE family protein n=1 Tax=Flavobacterium sp. TaxID=239 RepID=UPI003D1344BC
MSVGTIVALIITGLLAGMLSGLVGVGGGIIMVPMMVFVLGFSQHQAQGTSLAVLVVPVTALAVMNYYKEGYINWKYAAVIALFFVVGSYFGSKIAVNIDQKMLKKVFSIILVAIGTKMFFDK